MAVTPAKTWVTGEILTATDLNGEFLNVYNNGSTLAWPASTSKDLNGQELILDADADTSITADTDDRIDFRVGGTDVNAIASAGIGGDSNVVIAIQLFT